MSNTKQITEALKDLILNDDRAFVAMLSGEWGIGKTYFWQNVFVPEHLRGKKVVYISLFGQNSLQDIETTIVTKLYKYNKNLKKYTRHLDTIGNLGSKALGLSANISIGSLLSLFTPNDFKNIVICFDDFERLSDKVPLKDVMGLISQFKEQKECKIVMILNEKELDNLSDIDGKKHADIFTLYKEKIVDYSFPYNPSQEELFEAISQDIEKIKFCDHETIYNFFRKIDLRNIRIMKQALYLLEQFSFIGDESYDKVVIDEFVEIALNLFVFKARSNYMYLNFKDMKDANQDNKFFEDKHSSKEPNKHNKYEQFYYNYIPYRSTEEEIERIVYEFLDTYNLNQDFLSSLLHKNNNLIDKDNIQKKIFNLVDRLLFELSKEITPIIQSLYKILDENKKLVPHIIKIDELHRYFGYIQEHSSNLISEEFIDKYIWSYYDLKGHILRGGGFGIGYYIKFIEKHYPHLQEKLKKKIADDKINNIHIDSILGLIQKVEGAWSEEDASVLGTVGREKYKQYIQESREFLDNAVMFVKKKCKYKVFSTATMSIHNALQALAEENDDNKWRINNLLDKEKLSLESIKKCIEQHMIKPIHNFEEK